jgi:hypothetical protein
MHLALLQQIIPCYRSTEDFLVDSIMEAIDVITLKPAGTLLPRESVSLMTTHRDSLHARIYLTDM